MIYSYDAEEKVLGYFFNPYEAKEKKIAKLQVIKADDFHIEKHQIIYKAIKLFEVFDPIVLWDKLGKGQYIGNKDIEATDLVELDAVSEQEVESYLEILFDNSQKRALYEFGDYLKSQMINGKDQYETALYAQGILGSLTSKSKVDKNVDILDKVLSEKPGDVLSTGFKDIDKFVGGYARGMIITIAGDSGHLKTTLALDKAFRMAERNKDINIGIFSKEMLETDLMKKQIARICGIPISKIYSQEYNKEEVKKKMMNIEAWREDRVKIINPASFAGVADIAKIQMTHRFDVWFLDFIQLLEFAKVASNSSDYNIQIGQNMRSLQSLAISTKSVGVILSQVRKGVELRKVKKPTISDIEWSGLIKQLSSYIFFSYYPGKYYGFDRIKQDDYYLIGEKTRFSENFTYPIKVLPEYGQFEEIESAEERTNRVNNLTSILRDNQQNNFNF